MVLGQLVVHLKKKKCVSGSYLIPYTKMNSGEIKDLNVQRKTQKSTKTKVGIFI